MLKADRVNVRAWELMQPRSSRHNFNNYLKLFKLNRATQMTDALLAVLPQLKIQEFQLGSELFDSNPVSSELAFATHPNEAICYLIFDGQVRLLCQSLPLHRQISAVTLEEGECFGADTLFCPTSLPYKAIAASCGRLIQISGLELNILRERFPQFDQYLIQSAQQYEYLIFFKRFTHLGLQPSSTLRQLLLPRLVKQDVRAGIHLAHATPAHTGHFWLRAGQISSANDSISAPVIGDSWGYPNTIPNHWVAQTDLVVYKLSLDQWETNALLSLV